MKINQTVSWFIVLYLAIFVNTLISCQKNQLKIAEQHAQNLANLKDSASYTIDGKRYTCDVLSSIGRGNLRANWDSVLRIWNNDTIMYYSTFELTKQHDNNRSDNGIVTVFFIKKYSKSQMVPSTNMPALLQPKKFTDHYTPGNYQFVSDYESQNHQNGIKLIVRKGNDTESEMYSTISTNSNTPNNQNNSSFQIIRFESIESDGRHLIEASFNANVINVGGTILRVENGFLRFKL